MSIEAISVVDTMKLALDALEPLENFRDNTATNRAITALRQAIAVAEQHKQAQKQEALDRKAENARELGLDYEPEPIRLECVKCGTVYADGVPPQTTQKQEPVAGVSDHECRRLLYGFMLDCNAVSVEQAGNNLVKGMKQAAHGITGEQK